jgi:hypothetical protein
MTDSELIQEQIEKDVSQCQCRNPFNAQRMNEGKYRVRYYVAPVLLLLNDTNIGIVLNSNEHR